jgi:hypothetical protein
MFKENNNFLNKEQKNYLQNIFVNKDFPFYFSDKSIATDKSNRAILTHVILNRLDSEHPSKYINSNHYDSVVDILNSFLISVKEKAYFFTRISLNLTFNNGFDKSEIHQDHDYDHKQIIIYLNDCDKKAKTVIKQKGKTNEITPEKYKGICFGPDKHYHYFPKQGMRVILVATYI